MALTPAERLELIEQIKGLGDELAELARRAEGVVNGLASADAPGPQARPSAPRGDARPGGPLTGTP